MHVCRNNTTLTFNDELLLNHLNNKKILGNPRSWIAVCFCASVQLLILNDSVAVSNDYIVFLESISYIWKWPRVAVQKLRFGILGLRSKCVATLNGPRLPSLTSSCKGFKGLATFLWNLSFTTATVPGLTKKWNIYVIIFPREGLQLPRVGSFQPWYVVNGFPTIFPTCL